MKIAKWKIEDVRPYEKNPRQNDGAIDAVANSLEEFGWRQPIVVDKDDVIIVGHTRYKAALKLGYTHVPVHVAVLFVRTFWTFVRTFSLPMIGVDQAWILLGLRTVDRADRMS